MDIATVILLENLKADTEVEIKELRVSRDSLLAALEGARPLLAQAVDAVQGRDHTLQRLLDDGVQAADVAIAAAYDAIAEAKGL